MKKKAVWNCHKHAVRACKCSRYHLSPSNCELNIKYVVVLHLFSDAATPIRHWPLNLNFGVIHLRINNYSHSFIF